MPQDILKGLTHQVSFQTKNYERSDLSAEPERPKRWNGMYPPRSALVVHALHHRFGQCSQISPSIRLLLTRRILFIPWWDIIVADWKLPPRIRSAGNPPATSPVLPSFYFHHPQCLSKARYSHMLFAACRDEPQIQPKTLSLFYWGRLAVRNSVPTGEKPFTHLMDLTRLPIFS